MKKLSAETKLFMLGEELSDIFRELNDRASFEKDSTELFRLSVVEHQAKRIRELIELKSK